MAAGLFEVLSGRFLSGMELREVNSDEWRKLSILDNLTRLFNSRRGAIEHLPDYGLPDITQVYRELPYSVEGLRKAIKDTVETYEPRLRRVRVYEQKGDSHAMRIAFLLSAELFDGERVQFQTTFTSNDLAEVRPWRRPG